MSECELACPPSGHVTTLVNNLHYFCAGEAGGDYPGQEMVSIYLIKIKITTKFFNFIAKNTLTIS